VINKDSTTADYFTSSNGAGSSATGTSKPDLFSNLDALRMDQSFDSATVGVKQELNIISVRKPSKEMWFRTRDDFQLFTGVIELKEDSETYLVAPVLWDILRGTEPTFSGRLMIGAVTKQRVFFIWPLRMPGQDGKDSNWAKSARDAAAMACNRWTRIAANMQAGMYDTFVASGDFGDPVWPEKTFSELLRIAFRDRVIDSLDHPVLKKLRGEQ
jgi:hypothetical protein